MSQQTNLNVSPYFDDFDDSKNYYRVLNKPSKPIQAREINTLQAILQNQIEKFGNHIFKDGSVVIPGNISIQTPLPCVKIEPEYNGIPISLYYKELIGKKLTGEQSGVTAEVVYVLSQVESDDSTYTLYVKYLGSGGVDFLNYSFFDSETLIIQDNLAIDNYTFQGGQGVVNTISENAVSEGSAVSITSGIYFVNGFFVNVDDQFLLLDQYTINPSYKIGFDVIESLVSAYDDSTLFDNAQGFDNYAAPGADRLKIELILSKKLLTESTENFVEILRVENGTPLFFNKNSQYNLIRDELARRTYDESGDYLVKPFNVFVRDSLNDKILNDGIYFANQLTANGNTPREDLMVYQISPGKAYVGGYDVETISASYIDVEKTRETKTENGQVINYNSGVLVVLNNCFGATSLGLGTDSVVNLMSDRIGAASHVASGTTVGMARVYDFIPESDYVDDTSNINLRLFDIQTYTKVGLTTTITLSTPANIRGKRSNTTAYLRYSVTNSSEIVLYDVSGKFLENEQIVINEIDNNRLITTITDYRTTDIKSIHSNVGLTTFNGDVILSNNGYILPPGSLFKISSQSLGISTVTTGLQNNFTNNVSVGDIISYSNETGGSDIIYNKVTSVNLSGTAFTISGVTTVSGICDGALPSTAIEVSNLTKITSNLNAGNQSLLTRIGTNVSDIKLLDSEIIQRRSFNNVSFTSSSISITIDPNDVDVYFESFDEDRFVITYNDGSIEPMRRDKYSLNITGKTLTFNGLSKVSGTANVIATVKNLNPSHKIKKLNKASSLVVSKSKLTSSGIGTTSLNDGLVYSSIYGTRVQDTEISLNVPDVVRVLAVYESSTTLDPVPPTLELTSFTGINNNNTDFIVGEIITGQSSGAAAIIVATPGGSEINKVQFINLNTFNFINSEVIVGSDSKTQAVINSIVSGDNNITQNFIFDDGQRSTFYDYARIIIKSGSTRPSRKIKIYYQNYVIDSSDTGEFITANSYLTENFKHDVPSYSNFRLTDYIDIRPRVSPYTTSSYSPFEFNSRTFSSDGQYSEYILAPDENIVLDYSYYVGRIDTIFLNSNGTFEITQGLPSENPSPPLLKNAALDIANISIPPYVYSTKNIKVDISKHRRYRMSDISLLEDRIERVEQYTTLSLLESKTENFTIKDPETGLDRFKSGFFVDNFSNHAYHNLQHPSFRSSIDTNNNTLRPLHYTTSIDLQLGTEVISGIGQTYNPTLDHDYAIDLGSPGIRKTGDLITLNYDEVLYYEQLNATKSESVTPFLVTYWLGSIELHPPIDTWIDEQAVTTNSQNETRNVLNALPDENITIVKNVINNDRSFRADPQAQTGIAPFDWITNARSVISQNLKIYEKAMNSGLLIDVDPTGIRINAQGKYLRANGRGLSADDTALIKQLLPLEIANSYITELSARSSRDIPFLAIDFNPGNTNTSKQNSSTNTESIIIQPEIAQSTTVTKNVSNFTNDIRYLRSRNIEFDVSGLRPRTKFYPFFESIDVSEYTFPKLLEITMISGKFQIGEQVESNFDFITNKIKFRACSPNHKLGPHNSPTSVYDLNPYTQNQIETEYSESSTFINVDVRSLQLTSETDYYGLAKPGMKIVGNSSGAVAEIKSVSLISDNVGRLIGSLFIPNPNNPGNPKWTNGQNTFTVTDSSTLQQDDIYQFVSNVRVNQSRAEAEFTSSGVNNVTETNIISTRNITILPSRRVNTTTITNTTSATQSAPTFHIIDPLAQSFFVSSTAGIFLTSVEVYFETKDEILPVTLQIRPIVSGVPSHTIVPFSEVTLDSSQINLSVDGTVATRFTFPSPVYLNGPKSNEIRHAPIGSSETMQYAIVLLSNSPQYRVFIAELGFDDILTGNKITQQPTLGSLFKSQNATTWTPAQLEDLKYKLYRAEFVNEGLVRFFNPKLSLKNKHVTVTSNNQFTPLSKKIIVGLGSTGYNSSIIVPGITINQGTSYGNLESINGKITVGTGVTVINSGIGYSNGLYTNIPLETISGYGQGALANIIVSSNQISTVNITDGGFGYAKDDILLVPEFGQNVGFGGQVIVNSISTFDTFVLTDVQGQFTVGITSLLYTNSSGNLINVGSGVTAKTIVNDPYYTGTHMKIVHMNHGLHSNNNYAKITNFGPEFSGIKSVLSINISSSEITTIQLSSVTGFSTFENRAVSISNPGYVIIGDEVIAYTSISGSSLLGLTRGIDGTKVQAYSANTQVFKYEFNGISLRRINKVHNLSEVDTDIHPTTLNSYFIKIDQSNLDFDGIGIGTDRTNTLFFNKTEQMGSPGALLFGNIQYEALTPNIEYILPSQTDITTKIRTVTGTSISGNEVSFNDDGFSEIALNDTTYFNSPRLICSEENESRFIDETPGNRSFTMELLLKTNNTLVSPVIDTIQTSIILTSNLVNAPNGVENNTAYANDNNVRSINSDKHASIYISKPISLQIPANSLKVILPISRNNESDVRVLYQIYRADSSETEPSFDLFPGYSNYTVDGLGIRRVIDQSLNDGSSDFKATQSSNRNFRDYEYTVDDLPDFNAFVIKIVMASENQATPPIIKPIRVIATVKPRL